MKKEKEEYDYEHEENLDRTEKMISFFGKLANMIYIALRCFIGIAAVIAIGYFVGVGVSLIIIGIVVCLILIGAYCIGKAIEISDREEADEYDQ